MTIDPITNGPGNLPEQGNSAAKTTQDTGFRDLLTVINESKKAAKIDPLAQKEKDKDLPDLEYIEKYGFSAYAEKVRQEKIEEMREKILQAMGLSEEMLEEMPAEQRSALEARIAEEIERRLAAMAETKKKDEAPADKIGTLTDALSSRPGLSDGAALLQMLERQDLAEGNLPGEDEAEK